MNPTTDDALSIMSQRINRGRRATLLSTRHQGQIYLDDRTKTQTEYTDGDVLRQKPICRPAVLTRKTSRRSRFVS